MQPQTEPTLYEYLEGLPEGTTGEILDGQLHTQPRPSGPHAITETSLGIELGGPFHKGSGGPGGWWIIRLVPVDNSLIFINFMNRLRAKRTDSLTNRFFLLSIRPV